jgi:hypothetical protein
VTQLGWRVALESPCSTCKTTPCCTFVSLHRFKVDTLADLDYVRFLLNFDRIELGLGGDGTWSVYYLQACRNLDLHDHSCRVHGTSAQPRVCSNYNPYGCWYRRTYEAGDETDHLRIDRRRFEAVAERLVFDEHRRLVEVPAWEVLEEIFEENPLEDPHPEFSPTAEQSWQPVTLAPSSRSLGLTAGAALTNASPCDGCSAYCCNMVVFPQAAPTTVNSLDFLMYLVGFPGIEIGLNSQGWALIVHTTCRHLDGHRCGVYGRPERPIRCQYFDAVACVYESQFGRGEMLRLGPKDITSLADSLEIDSTGGLLDLPEPAALAAALRSQQPFDERSRSATPQ